MFISSAGTRGLLYRYVPYSKMKVGVEDAIKEMGFETAIVLRPGMILGEREAGKARAPILEKVIGSVHWISPALQDAIGMFFWSFSLPHSPTPTFFFFFYLVNHPPSL